jgi:flagellum-specific peptidoglycan hydrolase FlgJ
MFERRRPPQETAARPGLKAAKVFEMICEANHNNPNFTADARRQLALQLGGHIKKRGSDTTQPPVNPNIAQRNIKPDAAPRPAARDWNDNDVTALVDSLGDGELDVDSILAEEVQNDTTRLDADPHRRVLDLGELEKLRQQDVVDTHIGGPSIRERLASIPTYQRAIGTVAAALALASGAVVVHAVTASPDNNNCDTITQEGSNPGMTIGDIARHMTDTQGYTVEPAQVLRTNPQVVDLDTGDNLRLAGKSIENASETLKKSDNRYCFIVPAPVAFGQEVADGTMSLAQIANNIGQSVDTLQNLNAGTVPKNNTQPVPAGTIVWLDKNLDTDLILRKYHGEKLSELTAGVTDPNKKKELAQKLADANIATFMEQDSLEFQEGETYHLPYANIVQTPAMKQLGITSADILKAYKDQLTYDTRNKPIPEATPQVTTTPETQKKEALANSITDKQRGTINAMNLKPEQKDFIAKALDAIMKTHQEADQKHINTTVLLAQLAWESAYGSSEKAQQFQNYLGMKARDGDGWTGPTTGTKYPEGAYRVYGSLEECIKGYYDNINSPKKPWYDDAQKNYKNWNLYLAGLQNSDPANGEHAYAEDPNYTNGISGRITSLGLDDLINKDGLITVEAPAPTPTKSPEHQPGKYHNFKLDPTKYKNDPTQSQLPPNNSKAASGKPPFSAADHTGPWLTGPDGKDVLSKDMPYEQRLGMVEANLNAVNVTPEGLNNYKVVDLREKIANDPRLDNFHGTKEDPEIPNNKTKVKEFVIHFTATSQNATTMDGLEAAGSMQNSGPVGIQYYQDRDGTVYYLTDHMTYQVINWNGVFYNGQVKGFETAAVEQADISPKQYENIIYQSAKFLIDNQFIDKNTSITQTVNKMIKGHTELNPGHHSDNPSIVMDPIRQMIIDLLVAYGYKA